MTSNVRYNHGHDHNHMDSNNGHYHQLSSSISPSPSMAMSFGSWWDYKVTIMFSSWTTSTPTEFAFVWILVVLLVIGYHALRAYEIPVKKKLQKAIEDAVQAERRMKSHTAANENEPLTAVSTDDLLGRRSSYTTGGTGVEKRRMLDNANRVRFKWRTFHALLSACNYGIALVLMLIAMTYNVLLFVALIVGYAIGDFIMQGILEDSCH